MGQARIIYDERKHRYPRLKKKNPGATARKFRKELRRQKINFSESHFAKGQMERLGFVIPEYLKDREVVLFKW